MDEVDNQLTENQAPLPPPKHGLIKKTLKIIGIIIIVLIILYLIFLFVIPKFLSIFWGKDDLTVNDADLQLQAVSILEDQNSYYDLVKIGCVMAENIVCTNVKIIIPKDIQLATDYRNSDSWDNQKILQILNDNQAAMAIFQAASLKDKFADPAYSDPNNISVNSPITPMNDWRNAARLFYIKSIWLVKQGKDKEAFDAALIPIKIGQSLEMSQSWLITNLVGKGIKETGLEAIQKLISYTSLNLGELSLYINQIKQYTSKANSTYFNFSYLEAKDGLNNLLLDITSKLPANEKNFYKNNFYYKPNQTLNLFAQLTRDRIKEAATPCYEDSEIDQTRLSSDNPFKLYFTENAIGKLLYDMSAVSLNSIKTKRCINDTLISSIELMAAIKGYISDHNDYPLILDDLIPNYLSQMLTDPFSGQPFKYLPDKKIIYSIGSDYKDNGGGQIDDYIKTDEPTYSIDFAVKKLQTESATTTSSTNLNIDSDNDGLTDSEELIYGTDPNNPDTDGDSFKDGDEVKNGYNPKGAGKLIINVINP